jgi:uncharacterized protein with von Willebrand factor type A (vWA) domain
VTPGNARPVKTTNRELSVFSTSAVDLFASALGAFILLMLLLFPYYRHAGPETAPSPTQDLIERRREAERSVADAMAERVTVENEVTELEARADQLRRDMVTLEEQLFNLREKLAEKPPEVPVPPDIRQPYAEAGVEFSLLGINTERKSFVVVVDLSGSMEAYANLMIRSVLEILQPLDETNAFAILGYSGMGTTRVMTFPRGIRLADGTSENLAEAAAFTRRLASNFGGSTPTHGALLRALQYPADAVILISDGAPDGDPSGIVSDVTRLNARLRKEIHTVALGDYTSDRDLVLFLQELARRNGGDFVGVSR